MVPSETERVWSLLHESIRTFVSRRVRQPADVDDVVQRVFLQVHKSLPTLRDADRLHAWIYQTARRAIADYYRAPVHRREVSGGAELEAVPDVAVGVEQGGEDEPSVRQELAACIRPLMAALGSTDQEALRLIEVEGLTQVEAAGRLGLSVPGMKSRVQRARARLRVVVEACCRVELDRRGGLMAYEPREKGGCGPCG